MRELKRDVPGDAPETRGMDLGSHWSKRERALSPHAPGYLDSLRGSFDFWKDSWKEVFISERKSADLLAGLTVAAVALPLNVALAVACGLPATAGLIAGGVGGALAAMFGGAPLQVTGPAAALNALVLAIVLGYGPVGAVASAIVVGLIQIVLFFCRAGRVIQYVPESVLAGFTTGVGLKLLDQQIPLLLDVDHAVSALIANLSDPIWLKEVDYLAVLCGLLIMTFMLGLARFPKFPAAIVGITVATAISSYLGWEIHRVGTVPATLPVASLPDLEMSQWLSILWTALPLAILATAETLLTAKAVDRMRPGNKPHDSNLETLGQGVANVGAGLFGGLVVSGVIVRSSVNVQSGARTRLAALFHASLLLFAPLVASNWIAVIPIAALAGLLCLIGYRLVEVKTLVHLAKESKMQTIAFLMAAAGVVTGNLTAGLVAALVVSAAGYYLRKVAARRKRPAPVGPKLPEGVRAQIGAPAQRPDPFKRPESNVFKMPEENWKAHVDATPHIHPTAFIHPNSSIIGAVTISPGVHVAAEAALRADEGTPFFIGDQTNIQDGVVLHALKRKWVEVRGKRYAIYIGERCSLAHQALIHGPAYLGNDTFVGFKAIVHDSVVGNNCFIGIGSIVVGVTIPDGKLVPHGMLIDTAEKAAALPEAQPAHHHFNADVVEVNIGLTEAYHGEWIGPTAASRSKKPF